jgi:hypothetical protein
LLAKTQNVNYELVMPKNYANLSEEEMEYDGGLLNFLASAVLTVASIGLSAAAKVTSNDALQYASYACSAASVVCSFGVTAAVGAVAKGATNVAVTTLAKAAGSASASTVKIVSNAQLVVIDIPSGVISAGLAY